MLADMELEKELRVLYLEPQATGSELCQWVWLKHRRPQSPHFLQQGLTYFNKATPPDSATCSGSHFLSTTTLVH